VFVVDTTSHDVSDPIQLGRIPAAIVLTPDGSSVYVAEMPAEGQSGSATVIDTATNTVSTAVTLPGRAMGAAVTPDGQRVYVSTEGDGTTGHVMVIDTASNTVVADILDDPFPTRVTMNPNGIHAYVSGIDGGALVDVATNTIPARLDLGDSSLAMAVTLDGETAYLGSDNGFEVGVVNLTTHKFVTAVPVKGLQRDVTLTPDGRRVCVMRKSPNAIVLVDVTSNTRIEPPLAWNGTGVAVDVAPDGTRAYVADRGLEALVIVPLPPA
jgi:YVTN family beta-propeller protein